jgi:DNA-binding SARP family transcriptional activator
MEQAVALYEGDFLDGFYVREALEFDQWVLGRRAYLRERAINMLDIITGEHARRGQYKMPSNSPASSCGWNPGGKGPIGN